MQLWTDRSLVATQVEPCGLKWICLRITSAWLEAPGLSSCRLSLRGRTGNTRNPAQPEQRTGSPCLLRRQASSTKPCYGMVRRFVCSSSLMLTTISPLLFSPARCSAAIRFQRREQVPAEGERPHYSSVSSDGKRLVYTNLNATSSIWETSLASNERSYTVSQRLVQSGRNDVNPHLSLDGRQIAFASDRSGNFEILTCDRDGRHPRKVTPLGRGSVAGTPRWSPDGTSLAFDCRRGGKSRSM